MLGHFMFSVLILVPRASDPFNSSTAGIVTSARRSRFMALTKLSGTLGTRTLYTYTTVKRTARVVPAKTAAYNKHPIFLKSSTLKPKDKFCTPSLQKDFLITFIHPVYELNLNLRHCSLHTVYLQTSCIVSFYTPKNSR